MQTTFLTSFPYPVFYIYAFIRRFYPKRLTVHSSYTFLISICVPWESNPQPFALLTQCSTTEPQEHLRHLLYQTSTFTCMHLADAFIQKMLIQALHLLSVCVFPGNRTHDLLRC